MDYNNADVYYLNASPHVITRDPHTGAMTHVVAPAMIAPSSGGTRPRVTPVGGYVPGAYPAPYGYPIAGYPPAYSQWPYGMPNPLGNLGTIVNGMGGIGQLVDVAAQILATVLPIPAAPVAVGTGDNDTVGSDTLRNTKNLITYQSALASYAKRDEQIRTIGSLIKKLVG